MKEKVEVEVSTNTFLKSFFDIEYNKNKLLFSNLENIYSLITFLSNNVENLDMKTPDLSCGARKDLMEKLKLIEGFYKSMKIDFNIEDIGQKSLLSYIIEYAFYVENYCLYFEYLSIKALKSSQK